MTIEQWAAEEKRKINQFVYDWQEFSKVYVGPKARSRSYSEWLQIYRDRFIWKI
jgi:hypothetical protein